MRGAVFAAAKSRAIVRLTLLRSASGSVSDAASTGKKDTLTSAPSNAKSQPVSANDEPVNRAMKGYMRKVETYNAMISEHAAKFELGKRHIANIMGLDPNTVTQQDIDEAVEYLFPSGLFAKAARPKLKPPQEVFPAKKAPFCGTDGRPFHYQFYTLKPKYYELMHSAARYYAMLKSHEHDRAFAARKSEDSQMQLRASEWIAHDALRKLTLERVTDQDYAQFCTLFDRLITHPLVACNNEVVDFIMRYRKRLGQQAGAFRRPEVQVDSAGREYTESYGHKKTSRCEVKLYRRGGGLFHIDGSTLLDAMPLVQDRETIMYPLQFCDVLGEVDVEIKLQTVRPNGQPSGNGSTSTAMAIRLAIARALTAFVDDAMLEKMRLAGLLSQDSRHRERKKPGQPGARRKYTWVKR